MVMAYPSLTDAEFCQAGNELVQICEENLAASNWKSVRWVEDELQIQQTRNGPHRESHIDDEPGVSDIDEQDLVAMFLVLLRNANGYFQEAVDRSSALTCTNVTIDFSLMLSPTYQVPVLWFRFSSQVPTTVTALDRVYETIVLPACRDGLRQMGVLGGISIAVSTAR